MEQRVDFDIMPGKQISQEFISSGIYTFDQACRFIEKLPYRRNADKTSLASVFTDNCGTCSTKHALLKQLAGENNFNGIKLMLGIFKMNGQNTPQILNTLNKNQLNYMPEAHNYLKFENRVLDYTKPGLALTTGDLTGETEILPGQIAGFKIAYHKAYLSYWLKRNNKINLNLEELWAIREQCIADLQE